MHSFYVNILFATKTTLGISLLSLCVGLVLGLLLALSEISPAWLKTTMNAWIMLIRGLPEIFILFMCYYGLTLLLTKLAGHYVDLNPFVCGVIVLGIVFSAYASQIFIAALHAIPQEDLLAAQALGLSKPTIWLSIILPQLFRHALPGLLNLWLVLLKDSSIVSLIGLHDIMNVAHVAASETFKPFNFYLFAGGLYLFLTFISGFLGKKLETKLAL